MTSFIDTIKKNFGKIGVATLLVGLLFYQWREEKIERRTTSQSERGEYKSDLQRERDRCATEKEAIVAEWRLLLQQEKKISEDAILLLHNISNQPSKK